MTAYLLPEERRSTARFRANVYRFLAGVFLTPIPPEGLEYVRQLQAAVRAMPQVEGEGEMVTGTALLQEFAAEATAADLAKLQLGLAIERTLLCRGVRETDAPPPPFESLYRAGAEAAPTACLLAVVNAYQQAGWAVSEERRERPDYVGIELSFMAALCDEEPAAGEDPDRLATLIHLERRFVEDHLITWVPAYCRAVFNHARSSFFQGIAHLLLGFLNEEAQVLSEV